MFALEVCAVGALFIARDAGDDAAGRGVATGYAVVLSPLLLATGGLLYWAHGSTSRRLQWSAFLVAAIPFLIGTSLAGANWFEELSHKIGRAQAGKFKDPALTAIAGAIDRKDYAEVARRMESASVDWQARDGLDATLLGHAVKRVRDDYQSDPPVEAVRILIAHGAPLTDTATRPNEHLVETVFGGNSPGSIALLKLLFDSGADVNSKDSSGLPLIHTMECTLQKLQLLAEHGADLSAPGNRTDRPQWSPLMNFVYMRQWDQAKYLLSKGVRTDYTAPDGNTAASVLTERAAEFERSGQPLESGFEEIRQALALQKP